MHTIYITFFSHQNESSASNNNAFIKNLRKGLSKFNLMINAVVHLDYKKPLATRAVNWQAFFNRVQVRVQ